MAMTLKKELMNKDGANEIKNRKDLEDKYVAFAWEFACQKFKDETYLLQYRDSLCIVFSESDSNELSIVVTAGGENLEEVSYTASKNGTVLDGLENVFTAIENKAKENEMATDRGSGYLEVKY